MKQLLVFLVLIIFLLSCSSDSEFPKLYIYDDINVTHNGNYIIGENGSFEPTSEIINAFIQFGEEFIHDFDQILREEAFFIEEFEIIDETTIRFQMISGPFSLDTTLNYSTVDEEIVIDALSDTNFISYNSDNDQFELCSSAYLPLRGPNYSNQPTGNYGGAFIDCKTNNFEANLLNFINTQNYATLDTLGAYEVLLIYKRT